MAATQRVAIFPQRRQMGTRRNAKMKYICHSEATLHRAPLKLPHELRKRLWSRQEEFNKNG